MFIQTNLEYRLNEESEWQGANKDESIEVLLNDKRLQTLRPSEKFGAGVMQLSNQITEAQYHVGKNKIKLVHKAK